MFQDSKKSLFFKIHACCERIPTCFLEFGLTEALGPGAFRLERFFLFQKDLPEWKKISRLVSNHYVALVQS